jgi:hypothetical protein
MVGGGGSRGIWGRAERGTRHCGRGAAVHNSLCNVTVLALMLSLAVSSDYI